MNIPAFYLKRSELRATAERYAPQFTQGLPFPHVIIENFLPIEVAQALANEFPGVDDIPWKFDGPGDSIHSNDKNVEKIAASNEELFPPLTHHVMQIFNSGLFVRFVEQLTGFSDLSPDPNFNGCGLHSTGSGGRLMVHADASRHPNPAFDQILNMIYYVTPNWNKEWGGQLELWDEEAKQCITKISPTFNSALFFFTGTKSYHGHPLPLKSPAGVRRNSLSVYYYVVGRERDAAYEANKNYVEWIRTNSLDEKMSVMHRLKGVARKRLPVGAINKLATVVRALKLNYK